MSTPRRQNFLQTFLIFTTIYLGLILILNRNQPAPDTRPAGELLTAMRTSNAELKEQTLLSQVGQYRNKVNEQVKKGELKQEEADRKELEATILLAEAQYKAGIIRQKNMQGNDGGRLQQAYMTLRGVEKRFAEKPIWTELRVQTPNVSQNENFTSQDPKFANQSWSAKELYDSIVQRLDKKYKADLILGFIPGYQLIDVLVRITGAVPSFSYAFAAFLLALLVRAIVYPLAQRQFMWSRQMQALQPMVKEIKEKYSKEIKDPRTGKKRTEITDQAKFQQETMELYRQYGINPLAGCGPALLQMPLFLIIYQCMLHYQFSFQNGTFLWMNPATHESTNGWVAANLGQMDYAMIILYGISMVISTLLQPVSDPSQVRQQRILGVGISIFFTITMFFGIFPVPGAFVLYWTFTNILATAQALRAQRLPLPPLQKVTVAATGGAIPAGGSSRKASFLDKLQDQMREKYEEEMKRREAEQAAKSGDGTPSILPPDKKESNGQLNGKPKNGAPPKHKPKKRQ